MESQTDEAPWNWGMSEKKFGLKSQGRVEQRTTDWGPCFSGPRCGLLGHHTLEQQRAKIRARDPQTDVEPRANSKSNNLSFILEDHSCVGHTSSLFLLSGPVFNDMLI